MIDQKGKRVDSGIIDPSDIRMSRRKYYRYIGSLTVPPCTEEVVWMISREVTLFFINYVEDRLFM